MKHEQHQHGPMIETWLKEPTWLEPVDTSRVADIVHRTPQARRWSTRIDLGRFQPMFNATKFVAATIVLALVGGFLVTNLPGEPATEPLPGAGTASPPTPATAIDTKAPLITLPTELPEGVEGGTIETSAGPARWVHLRGPKQELPVVQRLLPWGGALAAWSDYNERAAVSSDGVTWNELPLPTDARRMNLGRTMSVVDATPYLVSHESGRAWQWDHETEAWNELDAQAMHDAMPSRGWDLHYGSRVVRGPTRVGDRVVFVVQYRYEIPRAELGISLSGTKNMARLGGGRYSLCGGGGCPEDGPKWVLRFEETERGLRVLDHRNGKRLGQIAGADASELYEGYLGSRYATFAIEDGVVVRIEPLKLGDTPAPDEMPPGLPSDARGRRVGATWYASAVRGNEPDFTGEHWLYLGDTWTHLGDMGLPAWVEAYDLRGTTVLTTDVAAGELDVWVLTHPASGQTE